MLVEDLLHTNVLMIIPTLLSVIIKTFSFSLVFSVIAIIILLLISAFISSSEIAFFSLTPTDINELNSGNNLKYKDVIQLLERPKQLLATLLITLNFINVGIVIISTFIVNNLLDVELHPLMVFIVQAIVITSLILFFGEILPKVYATQNSLKLAVAFAKPVQICIRIFYPLSTLLVKSSSLIDKRIKSKKHNISISELSNVIDITSDENTPIQETNILKGIVKFGDIDVKEIMKSRVDVVAVENTITFKELMTIVLDAGYSRIPVYNESFDSVTGVLYIKDLLPHMDKTEAYDWNTLLRPAYFVPENKKINDLLREFQELKIHLAVVVDEYGGTSGIITLEDIIEEIVGEIDDEFDVDSEKLNFTKIDDNNYMFDGKTSIQDFYKILNIEENIFDEIKGESESLAGLILEVEGKIPEKNAIIRVLNYTFKIEMVDNRRIKRIKTTIENQ